MRAMVLAAGLGTRLRPITYEVPKPMVPVVNRPVMEHIVGLLTTHGFGEVVANLHWFPETIEQHFGDGSDFGLSLTYSREQQLLGTAGGVRKAAGFLGDDFLIISGDALTDIDLAAMRRFHESHDGIATLATRQVEDTSQFGVVIAGSDGRIQGFQEKPDPAEALSQLANCGIYMFRAEIFDYFPTPDERSKAAGPDDPPDFTDWALDVFPALLSSDVPFYSHTVEAYWNDIGNLRELWLGNVDALEGTVRLQPRGKLASPRVLVGESSTLGEGAEISPPAVIGPGCRIGDGAQIAESLLLAGTEVAAGAELTGVIALPSGETVPAA
jgi:mannose-1-phosphate guanylyltransferase